MTLCQRILILGIGATRTTGVFERKEGKTQADRRVRSPGVKATKGQRGQGGVGGEMLQEKRTFTATYLKGKEAVWARK